jgi:adenosylcobinamide-GDP ribazoletransferase
MSPVKTIKTFRDSLSFLTIIPVGGKEDFIFTTASNVWLFPLLGGFIGLLGATYFIGSGLIVNFLLGLVNSLIPIPSDFLSALIPAAMTIAFLLVLTGLQHFDGLIDLGNAVGLRNLHDRKMKAHAWTVTHWGAVLAMAVEFTAFLGLFLVIWFFINPWLAFAVIFASEVAAKLSMVTIVWIGKPSHKGLGSIFLAKAKKPLNTFAYIIAFVIVLPIFAFLGSLSLSLAAVAVVFSSIPIAIGMEKVSNKVFGGVSGDMIGATNEVTRAIVLVLFAVLLLVMI